MAGRGQIPHKWSPDTSGRIQGQMYRHRLDAIRAVDNLRDPLRMPDWVGVLAGLKRPHAHRPYLGPSEDYGPDPELGAPATNCLLCFGWIDDYRHTARV